MVLFYNLGIRLYYFLILLVSPFKSKARKWIEGRKGTLKQLGNEINPDDKTLWFHVSSLGEFEQGRPIIESIKHEYPNHKVVLSFFSPSGYEIRKNYQGADVICYLPLDTRKNARKFISIVHPEITLFVKYDYWYHHLKEAKKANTRLLLVSGIFRDKQVFFKGYGKWYRQMLKWFEHFFVQNEESKKLLNSLGIEQVTVAGDTRFDRVLEIARNAKSIPAAEDFSKNSTTIVCGSTWPEDEAMLLRYQQEENSDIKLILAPHEIDKAHIDKLISQIRLPYACYSKKDDADLNAARIFIIDNIGMLSSLYRYGQIAYIGGGFGNGIHNTLEAAVFVMPVLFGPNYHKFQEAHDLIRCNGAISFNSYDEFKTSLDNLLSDTRIIASNGKASVEYVKEKAGATTKILDYLMKG